MKLIKLSVIIAMLTSTAYAKYDVVLPLDIPINFVHKDSKLVTEYGNWLNVGMPSDCSSWSPLENTITINQGFTQNSSCNQKQTRTVQQYLLSLISGEKVPYGEENQEEKTIDIIQTQSAIGSLETWEKLIEKLIVSDWTNSGSAYNCYNWTPSPNTVDWKVSFNQTTNECKQKQIRVVQEQEQEKTTLVIRNVGSQITENQEVVGSNSMTAYGTRAAILNNPLKRFSSNVGIIGDGMVTAKGTAGPLIYGPYVKDFPLGTYNLKIYGSTGVTTGATFDVSNSAGLFKYVQGELPANESGLLVDTNFNITSLDQNYGIEVRVMIQSTTVATINAYELVKID